MSSFDDLPVWRNGAFRDDDWVRLADPDPRALSEGSVLLPYGVFTADPARYLATNARLGVEVAPGEDVRVLEPHLTRLQLIALMFPKFSDGRSYSSGRLLRERLGYRGELRATGDVLQDQIPLMRRCGFDSFAVHHGPTRHALETGHLAAMRHFYQPLPLAPEVPAGTRPWARLPSGDAEAKR